MDFDALITQYGYIAITIGTFFEGESLLMLAGYLTHSGYFKMEWVVVSAFIGTLAADQLYFHIGRLKGKSIIESRPAWKKKSEHVLQLLEEHHVALILGFRFLKGFRIITPLLLGTTSVSSLRYLILNTISVAIWAIAFAMLGYFFGTESEDWNYDIPIVDNWLIASVVVAVVILWLYLWKRRDWHIFKKHHPAE